MPETSDGTRPCGDRDYRVHLIRQVRADRRVSMRVPVMQIGVVRMRMHERCMAMRVGMRFGAVPRVVRMPVMFVMDMRMAVLLRRMPMQMLVAFREMQPHASSHQQTGSDELPCDRLAHQQQRKGGAEEGSN